jgi:plastocyanin
MRKQTFNKIKKTVTIMLAIFFVATLTATSVSAKTVDVSIKDYKFNPQSVEVSNQDYVKWTNNDKVDHTVTGDSTLTFLHSGTIRPGQSYEYFFNSMKPGYYDYKCSIHTDMKGTLKFV